MGFQDLRSSSLSLTMSSFVATPGYGGYGGAYGYGNYGYAAPATYAAPQATYAAPTQTYAPQTSYAAPATYAPQTYAAPTYAPQMAYGGLPTTQSMVAMPSQFQFYPEGHPNAPGASTKPTSAAPKAPASADPKKRDVKVAKKKKKSS